MVAIIAGFMDEIWGMAESDAQGEITYTGADPTSFKKAVTVYTHKGETPQQALIDFPKRLHGMYWARVATSKEVAEKKT